MARPTVLDDAKKLNFWFDGDTIEQLDALRRAYTDIPSRAEMLRRLVKREWQRFAPPEPKRRPKGSAPSVCEFLRRRGGIRDDHGELAAMNLHRERPGLVNNKAGVSLDTARELLVEFGYLHEAGEGLLAITTTSDVLDLIRDELAGAPRIPADIPF